MELTPKVAIMIAEQDQRLQHAGSVKLFLAGVVFQGSLCTQRRGDHGTREGCRAGLSGVERVACPLLIAEILGNQKFALCVID